MARQHWLKKTARGLLGSSYPLAAHFVEITGLFIVLLGCIWVVRHLIPLLFPPGPFLADALHLGDTYAALLGIVGYVVWITLDMIFVLKQRADELTRKPRHDANKD